MKPIALVVFLSCASSCPAQSGWVARQSHTQNSLLAVRHFVSQPSALIAVGSNYVIIRSTDAGMTWHEGFDPKYLFDVAFTDTGATAVPVAVGARGRILRGVNGGTSWSPRVSGTTRRLNDVDFPTPSVGYVVGENGAILKTTDAGLTWFSGGVASPFDFNGVSFINADTGTIVGANGAIFRTATGGSSWIAQNSGTPRSLHGVDHSHTDPDKITAVGDSGLILSTTDGGLTWVGGGTPDPSGLQRITYFDTNHGAVIGEAGIVLLTSDGGATWGSQLTGVTGNLNGVAYSPDDPDVITAVGEDGIILSTTNGGSTWSQQTSFTTNVLRGIAITRTTRIAAGAGDVTRRSTNNGASWSQVTNAYILRGVCTIAGSQQAWAVGDNGSVYQSEDGGLNWTAKTAPQSDAFSSVSFLDSLNGYLGSYMLGRVYRTTDAGMTWTNTATPPPMVRVYDLAFTSPDSGHAAGSGGINGKISITTNSGSNWTSQTPSGFGDLHGITFFPGVPGNRTAVGDSGLILHTTDFGGSWAERTSGTIRDLEGVSFAGPSDVYTVGEFGTILHSTDGGESWASQSSGTTTRLNDIVFLSIDTGVVVGNSGLVLTTTNGGLVTVGTGEGTSLPQRSGLLQNYPNPFNPTTNFEFRISSAAVGFEFVTLKVYDVLGREVATLVNERLMAGTYTRSWNAASVSSGMYLCRLTTGHLVETKRLILLK